MMKENRIVVACGSRQEGAETLWGVATLSIFMGLFQEHTHLSKLTTCALKILRILNAQLYLNKKIIAALVHSKESITTLLSLTTTALTPPTHRTSAFAGP